MDVLYLLGPTAPSNYAELRYSLRSIHTNLAGLQRVIIVGARPSWLTDAAEYLPYPQAKYDWGNQVRLLQHACQHKTVPDEFVLMNDDFHLLRPADHIPVLHNGPLVDLLQRYRSGYYHQATRRTLDLLEARGITNPLAYDGLHVPLPVHRDDMAKALHAVTPPIQHRSLYGAQAGIGGQPGRDAKGHQDGGTWASTSTPQSPLGVRLRRAFTTPSPYEV